MRKLLLLAAGAMVSLVGCVEPPAAPGCCTPREAFAKWQAAPDKVYILDVRTTAEFIFIGHAPMARNIPVKLLTDKWDADRRKPVMRANPNFLDDVKKTYKPDDAILVMCRTGERAADAIRQMKAAGFTSVLNIEGGFEGLRGTECTADGASRLIKPGWKNSGLIWTTALDPESMYLPEGIVTTRPAAAKKRTGAPASGAPEAPSSATMR
jgi:rhodanese-related sulfurtransferase